MIPSSTRASVVLPLPDSPTSPSVSPGRMSRSTPSQRVDVDWPDMLERLGHVARAQTAARSVRSSGSGHVAAPRRRGAASARARGSGSASRGRRRPRTSAACSVRQRSSTRPQRSAKMQPGELGAGRRQEARDRVQPALVPCSWPRRGMQRSSPTVYGWRGSWNTSSAGPSSTSSPAYSTPTRSHILAITPRLWLMNSSEVLNSARSADDQVEHLGLDGRVERRSSARRGSAAPARRPAPSRSRPAAACRPRADAGSAPSRWPGSEICTFRSASSARSSACLARDAGDLEHLGDLAADADRRVERAAGVLVDHRHGARAQLAQLLARPCSSTLRPSIAIEPPLTLPLRGR